MKVIGLTGGIGSGKSTVSKILAELGAVVIDLDKVGHEVYIPGQLAYDRIVAHFGTDILNTDGTIDRPRLGSIVFNDRKSLAVLNDIVHPAIHQKYEQQLAGYRAKGASVVVLEGAILLEVDFDWHTDEIWVVVAPEDAVLERLSSRPDYSEDVSRSRIRAQMSNEERAGLADVVITNDSSPDALRQTVIRVWNERVAR